MQKRFDFLTFIKAFAAHWFSGMSGSICVPLVIISFFVPTVIGRLFLGLTAIACAMVASYQVWKIERQAVINFEKQLKDIMDEYIYALQLEGIDHVNVIPGGERIARRCELRLRNSINRPLYYEVIKFEVNGISSADLLNTGGGLSPLATTKFRSSNIAAPPVSNKAEEVQIFMLIHYGPPDQKPIRKITKKVKMVLVPNESTNSWAYEIDKDELIENS